jgi:hypothetical protein
MRPVHRPSYVFYRALMEQYLSKICSRGPENADASEYALHM